MTATDDATLIARVLASDDRHAFTTLVRRHQGPVRAFLVRLCCGDQAAADDLAQESFLRAYRALPSYQHRGSFASWLFALAYRAFLSDRRRVRHQRENLTGAEDTREGEHIATPILHVDLERAMARLRPEERAALSLCMQWGLSHDEAAEVLGCPAGTVKTHILRGRARLRGPLSDYADDVASAQTKPRAVEVT